jgi:hypothetical protein
MTVPLPPYAPYELVQERLLLVFPEGFEFRNYCTRDIATATVFGMLYIGAVASSGRMMAPKHVYRMSDEQSELTSDAERFAYITSVMRSGSTPLGQAWYADTTRESIRDETIRQGFGPVGAALDDKTIPTNSSKPRYALADDFAALFDPGLTGNALDVAIADWHSKRLSPAALARIKLVSAGTGKSSSDKVLVTFPNQETRRLAPGPSAVISKAVIEEFTKHFLTDPGVIWLSESGNKVVAKDDDLARSIGLTIDPSRNLPDIILVDLGDKHAQNMLLVFVEVVATDGPISTARRTELLEISRAAKFDDSRVAFVTAFLERGAAPLKKTLPTLAWNSFVWLASEPENIVALYGESSSRLQSLMQGKLASVTPLRPV